MDLDEKKEFKKGNPAILIGPRAEIETRPEPQEDASNLETLAVAAANQPDSNPRDGGSTENTSPKKPSPAAVRGTFSFGRPAHGEAAGDRQGDVQVLPRAPFSFGRPAHGEAAGDGQGDVQVIPRATNSFGRAAHGEAAGERQGDVSVIPPTGQPNTPRGFASTNEAGWTPSEY